jgi:apolipoprotein N-acyltransferase
MIHVNVEDPRWRGYEIDFEKIAGSALFPENKGSELSITLADDERLRGLSLLYRGRDSPTNVLSFESGDSELLGDIFISFDAVMREAPDDFAGRAAHLAVHGALHLQGCDHMSGSDAEEMEAREIKILKKLGIKNPCRESLWRRALSAAAFFAIGAAGALGFAPWHFWPAAIASVGAAYWAMTRGKRIGFWWGAGYAAANFHWSLESIFANADLARQLWYFYPIGLVGIALAGGAVFGLPFCMTRGTESAGARRTVYFALAWTFTLWLREWLLTGFPWNPLANILLPFPAASNLMSVFGALGLTFVLAGAIAAPIEYFRTRAKWQFLFFAPLLLAPLAPAAPRDMTGTRVLIVQPAFDMNRKFDRAGAEDNIKTLVDLSVSAPKRDMVIWPETAYPYLVNDTVRLPALGSPLVAGATYLENGRIYNAMLLADNGGRVVDKYFKSHLVPFGEYRPLGDLVPTPGQLAAGRGARVMADFVPAICYEIAFSDSLVPRGERPRYILNITNDAWFGRSSGPHQHLDMARRQAIETGLPVIRANYAGISAMIDASGNIAASLPLGVRGALDAAVPQSRETLFRWVGLNRVMLIIVLLCAPLLLRPRRHKNKGVIGPPAGFR